MSVRGVVAREERKGTLDLSARVDRERNHVACA